ncbi:hypothetical protein [Pseudonocardia sp. T1-2H]|uniref:hypothetical protein n=1 Tax=Pseudonocardia sp. T1-2H TaxID=3128899 RepID=UPI003100F3C1
MGRSPQRFLAPGDVLESWIEGVGEMRQSFVAAERPVVGDYANVRRTGRTSEAQS